MAYSRLYIRKNGNNLGNEMTHGSAYAASSIEVTASVPELRAAILAE